MNLNKLNINSKVSQMFLLGLDVYDINEEIIELIKEYKIGGVVLYKKNYTSLDSMIDVINKLKDANKDNDIPLFIGIDQENGRVNRLPKEIELMASPRKQAKTKNLNIISDINTISTYLLKSIGVNMNFAPVLDIVRSDKNKAIGDRSYGDNIEDVLKYGIPFMKIMQENEIISVIKHFPGHGATNRDSHVKIPKIKDVETLKNEDIKVFEEAIKSGAEAIMVGHLLIKGYGYKPASINKKIINELLIDNTKYKGLIITDDLRMNTLRYHHGLKKCVKYAIEAGNNLIMIKYKKGDIKKLYKKIFKMVNNFEIDLDCINNSYKKIISYKKKYNLSDEVINPKLDIELINKKIIKINEKINKEIGDFI